MQNFDFQRFYIFLPYPINTNKQISPFLQNPNVKFEEEDGESYSIPDNSKELEDWWEEFYQRNKYPLYCMVLAANSDEHIATLINKHRSELANIAGDKCCFIYFRDIKKAKLLEPFQFKEHVRGVEQVIEILDIQQSQLPCIIFFEQITTDDFVLISMEHKTISEYITFFRDLFTFIYSRREISLEAVKAYNSSVQVKTARKNIMSSVAEIFGHVRKEFISELVKLSLTRLP